MSMEWVRITEDGTRCGPKGFRNAGAILQVGDIDAARMVNAGRAERLTEDEAEAETTRTVGETDGTSAAASARGGKGRAVRHAETR